MKYEILTYGNRVLREKSRPVPKVDADIRQLAKRMLETMYLRNGVGLAAEQIGRTESICVIDVPPGREAGSQPGASQPAGVAPQGSPAVPMPLVMVNPRITAVSGEQVAQEGCLSIPEVFVSIKRAEKVTVTFTSLNNTEETLDTHGLLARAVQHELDHLNGTLLVDRMFTVQKLAVAGKLKRLKKAAQEQEPQ